ncbi:unnamed protein product, partial [Didymodactylos carnosus]
HYFLPFNFSLNPLYNCDNFNLTDYSVKCLKWTPDHRHFWKQSTIRHTIHEKYLNSSSLIVEIGGNVGQDIAQYIRLYNSTLIIYEPLTSMYKVLKEKLGNRSRTEIHRYGLGVSKRQLKIRTSGTNNEATSMFTKENDSGKSVNETMTTIDILNIIDVLQEILIRYKKIDLLTMNCEGCEFEILPALIEDTTLLTKINNIQFATHIDTLEYGICIYCKLQQDLQRKYEIFYQYKVLWESWTKKKND